VKSLYQGQSVVPYVRMVSLRELETDGGLVFRTTEGFPFPNDCRVVRFFDTRHLSLCVHGRQGGGGTDLELRSVSRRGLSSAHCQTTGCQPLVHRAQFPNSTQRRRGRALHGPAAKRQGWNPQQGAAPAHQARSGAGTGLRPQLLFARPEKDWRRAAAASGGCPPLKSGRGVRAPTA